MHTTLLMALATGCFGLSCGATHAEQRPAVVELFTSEGCSSCPPAEAYIAEIAGRSDVLALSFHVDYWDDLGWRDRFDIPEATARQRGYMRALRLSSVYTPQVVIDGYEDFVGSDRAPIGRSIANARTGIPLTLAFAEDGLKVNLTAVAGVPRAEVLLVAYRASAVSAIGRGENSGRTLTEYHIVRAVRHLGSYSGEATEYAVDLESLPKDATHVAVLVQLPDQGPIIGASSRALR